MSGNGIAPALLNSMNANRYTAWSQLKGKAHLFATARMIEREGLANLGFVKIVNVSLDGDFAIEHASGAIETVRWNALEEFCL